jgi:hypothetical protein
MPRQKDDYEGLTAENIAQLKAFKRRKFWEDLSGLLIWTAFAGTLGVIVFFGVMWIGLTIVSLIFQHQFLDMTGFDWWGLLPLAGLLYLACFVQNLPDSPKK